MSSTTSSVMQQVRIIADGKSKKAKQAEDPTTAPLTNFMNGAVARSVKDTSKPANTICNIDKNITYKEYSKLKDTSKKSNEHVIDLKRFEGIAQAQTAYSLITEANKDIDTEDEKFNASAITAIVDEPITRGYLSMAETRFVEPKKRAKKVKEPKEGEKPAEPKEDEQPAEQPAEQAAEDIVSDRLDRAIKTLGLPKSHEYTVGDFIKAINDVVNDTEKFKLKAFNKSFPLAVHDEEKDAGHVNSKYQQHYVQHFDDLLKFMVENIEDADLKFKTLVKAHEYYAADFEKTHTAADPTTFTTVLQIKTFLTRFNDNPNKLLELLKAYVAHKKGVNDDVNELTIKKDIKAYPLVVKAKGAKSYSFDKDKTIGGEKVEKDVFELVVALRKYLIFINTVLDGKEYFERKSGSGSDYKAYYKRYLDFCQQQEEFIDEHSDVPETVEGLITYLVQAIVFISKFRSDNKKDVAYITASEFNSGKVIFKVNLKLMKKLKEFYTLEDAAIAEAVDKLLATDDFKYIVESQDLSVVGSIATVKETASANADIFAKIGQLANNMKDVAINKNTRIALGLAIVKYVIIETNRILALESGKKSGVTIYIKY